VTVAHFWLDPGADLSVNSSASVAIAMAQEGERACKMDVEDPTCWKLTLTGKVVPVPADQRHYAEKVLFSKYVLHERSISCLCSANAVPACKLSFCGDMQAPSDGVLAGGAWVSAVRPGNREHHLTRLLRRCQTCSDQGVLPDQAISCRVPPSAPCAISG
jgi:hypothetical protein